MWVALVSLRAETDFNARVLATIPHVPPGGGYSVTSETSEKLRSAVQNSGGDLILRPKRAMPSYCSGATYLIFLNAVRPNLTPEVAARLADMQKADGHGVWGRWNANGPGTARLFHELGLGRNFTNLAEAKPGDFLKIFWRDAVGKNEFGHSVIFLGTETKDGEPHVRFWSSNKPEGYGEKSVPLSKCKRLLFSRLEHPERIKLVTDLPEKDAYLASLLTVESSFTEALRKSGAN